MALSNNILQPSGSIFYNPGGGSAPIAIAPTQSGQQIQSVGSGENFSLEFFTPSVPPTPPVVLSWVTNTTTTISMVQDTGYIVTNAESITLTLPVTCEAGHTIGIIAGPTALGSPVYTLAQNDLQTIYSSSGNTTTGTEGYITTNSLSAPLILLCLTSNTDFAVISTDELSDFIFN